jgi:hypothetical protein
MHRRKYLLGTAYLVNALCFSPTAFCQPQPAAFQAAGEIFFTAFDEGNAPRLAATMGPHPQALQTATAWIMLPRRDLGIATKRELVGLTQLGASVLLEYRTVFSRSVDRTAPPQRRNTALNKARPVPAPENTETQTEAPESSDSGKEALAANQTLCRELLQLTAAPQGGIVASRYFVLRRPKDEPLSDAEKGQLMGQNGLMWMGKPYQLQ